MKSGHQKNVDVPREGGDADHHHPSPPHPPPHHHHPHPHNGKGRTGGSSGGYYVLTDAVYDPGAGDYVTGFWDAWEGVFTPDTAKASLYKGLGEAEAALAAISTADPVIYEIVVDNDDAPILKEGEQSFTVVSTVDMVPKGFGHWSISSPTQQFPQHYHHAAAKRDCGGDNNNNGKGHGHDEDF